MRGKLLRCVGLFAMCLLVSGVAAAKDSPQPYYIDVPSECDMVAGNVVANCGFETGALPPWILVNDPFFTSVVRLPHTGDFALESGPTDPAMGFVSQMVPTVVGTTYHLTFWLNNNNTPNRFQVSWEGAVIFDQTNLPNQQYTLYSFNVVSCNATSQLKFGFYNLPDFMHLDDVELVAVADGEEE